MNERDYVPIAALNQFAYCAHRCWRMFCAGGFVENQFTLEGTGLHERVHAVGSGRRDEVWQVRGIWLRCDRYGLIGKSDLIEDSGGELYPVEYKRGKGSPEKGASENDVLQVCAQAFCLEEMTGREVRRGFVYYAHSHQRREVVLDEGVRERTVGAIASVREIINTGTMPEAVYKKRCRGCSLYGQCLPQARKKVGRYREAD